MWKGLGVLPHSGHGSASDQGAVISIHAPEDVRMLPQDEQALGHWRRRATASSSDGELAAVAPPPVPDGTRPAPAAAAPAGTAAEHAHMRVRYTSGVGREGRRREQVAVRARWVRAVRRGLARFGRPWQELPGDRSDYDILVDLPPAPPA